MTTSAALAVTLLVMTAVNVWAHLGPRRIHLITGPLAAAALLLVARSAGLSWADLGLARDTLVRGAWWGAVAAGLVCVGYGVAPAIPATRAAFRDTRYQVGAGSALYTAFVAVPLATVVFEEVAFRGALWGLLAQDHGTAWATGASSVLFGLWHVLPALAAARTNAALQAEGRDRRSRLLVTILGTVTFTIVAGVVFAELRRRSGSLLAPAGLHWATNGLGVLIAARIWAISRK